MINCRLYLKVFFIFLNLKVVAQNKQITSQSLYWTRYYNQLTINKKWTLHNEFDNRRFFEKNKQHHFIAHTRIHYKLKKKVEIGLGFTYSRQSHQVLDSATNLVIPEFRPNQEINLTNVIKKKISFNHRFRIDERFFAKNNGEKLLGGYDFNVRFRYRFQANFSLNNKKNLHPTNLKLATEIMVNAGKNIVYNKFDQLRYYAGFEQSINRNFSAEIGYMYWYQKRPIPFQYFERDIIRFTLHHKLNIKKLP